MSPAEQMAMAREYLADAERVLSISSRLAAREAYAAVLHAANARIAAAGRKVPRTHNGVNAVVGELYRDTGFPGPQTLSDLEQSKLASDYLKGAPATPEQAEHALTSARLFIDRMIADIHPDDLREASDPETVARLKAMHRGDQS